MMNANDRNQPAPPQAGDLDLTAYKERVDKGMIFWTLDDGQPIMNVKQYDAAHNEVAPLRFAFTPHQIEKIRNDIDRQILGLRDQILDIQTHIENLEMQKTDLYGAMMADIDAVKTDAQQQSNSAEAGNSNTKEQQTK
jgi:hypothetical protein